MAQVLYSVSQLCQSFMMRILRITGIYVKSSGTTSDFGNCRNCKDRVSIRTRGNASR
jgi:hypothetical protein